MTDQPKIKVRVKTDHSGNFRWYYIYSRKGTCHPIAEFPEPVCSHFGYPGNPGYMADIWIAAAVRGEI